MTTTGLEPSSPPPLGFTSLINSVRTGCIAKGKAQEIPLSWRFLGSFDFLRCACSLRIPLQEPLNWTNSPMFTNTPCRSTPLERDSANVFIEFQGRKWSCSWCRGLIWAEWSFIHSTLAHRNRSDFCDLRLRCPSRTPEIASDYRDFALCATESR